MPENLRKYKKLLVVSDTGMFHLNNRFYAFGPVVRELDALLDIYEQITWIGFEREDQKSNKSFIEVENKKIRLVFLPKVGGKNFLDKMKILVAYPKMIKVILKEISSHSIIHSRAPSNPAIISMIFSPFFKRKKFWFKYAGSWVDQTSLSYSFQRLILKKLRRSFVTINGSWESQKKHVLTFENPCLTYRDRIIGKKIVLKKRLESKPTLCFVGNLDENKGVLKVLASLERIDLDMISDIHIVGDGPFRQRVEDHIKALNHNITLHGFLEKREIIKIFEMSHFIILPSNSEGFPKVIAEAMNFACVPIVSDVSCIGQYIIPEINGFLLKNNELNIIVQTISKAITLSVQDYNLIIKKNYEEAFQFTFDTYTQRVSQSIMK